MTPFERFVLFLVSLSFNLWSIVKILVLLGLLIYIAFAIIVIRQVALMSQTIKVDFNLLLRLISWVHFGVVVMVFILALVIL